MMVQSPPPKFTAFTADETIPSTLVVAPVQRRRERDGLERPVLRAIEEADLARLLVVYVLLAAGGPAEHLLEIGAHGRGFLPGEDVLEQRDTVAAPGLDILEAETLTLP